MIDPVRALARIWNIVHTPSKATSHKKAQDHYMADFDAIRAEIKSFIDAGFLDPKEDANDRNNP